ncbi:MAG: hypothetical protein GY841_05570 [FCB group bacterium]|nr:hypothetical protein [FCB group bacterium]
MFSLIVAMVISLTTGCGTTGEPASGPDLTRNQQVLAANIENDTDNSESSSGRNTDKPVLVTTTSDSTVITVNEAEIDDDQFIIDYQYQAPGSAKVRRVLKIDQTMAGIVLEDERGRALWGYRITSTDDEWSDFSLMLGENRIFVSRNPETDTDLELKMTYQGATSEVSFATMDDFITAVDLYQTVHSEGYVAMKMAPHEEKLVAKIEEFNIWVPAEQESTLRSDMAIAQHLMADSTLSLSMDRDSNGEPQFVDLKWYLSAFCKIVWVAERICGLLGEPDVCVYVEVAKEICDYLKDVGYLQ